ncbi:hypothetical protein MTR67_007704 [Solanum verrucosum]|uniref:Uncharacterized protein n=1 Tax=Solanum verrucosum TaxID=315347 RepID=A0AAF0TDB5_SOLVR|nr:hypothetical protein MTR67_007704 [Solanum verrucosum]
MLKLLLSNSFSIYLCYWRFSFSMGILKEDDGGGSKEESCITDSEYVDDEEHEKDEAFRKNPYMCEHSVDHYYYLLPRAQRSKIFTRKKPPTVIPSQEKGLEIRITLKHKTDEIVDEDLSMAKKKTEILLDEKQSKEEDRAKKRRKIKP